MPNAIDLPPGNIMWAEQDKDLYNKLPFFLAKNQVELQQHYTLWGKLLPSIDWSPKNGTTMRGVRKEPSPILRGQFLPNTIQQSAKKDIVELQETKEEAQLYHHKVESQLMTYHAEFQDFLESVSAANEDITQKISYLPDLFYRTALFHAAPVVWVCGVGPVESNKYWTGANVALSKDATFLKGLGQSSNKTLTLNEFHRILQYAYNDLQMVPFSGKTLPDGTDGKALDYKFLLATCNEVWQNFQHDPWLTGNRQLDLDIVTDGFRGSLFGQAVARFERYEMRFSSNNGTILAPEVVEMGANAYDKGRSKPDPAYINADVGIGFLVGKTPARIIKPGPPPSPFSSGKMSIDAFNKMDWNGKTFITRDVMVRTVDEASNIVLDTNKYGEYGQILSKIAMGILLGKRTDILPIIYKRARVQS